MDGYNRTSHNKHSLKIHLILVTKYRKRLFAVTPIADDIKQLMYDAANRYGYSILKMETDKDHIHMLIEYSPKVSIADIVSRLKQYSTYHIWNRHHNYMSKRYWKHRVLWSDGYFVSSIGQVSQATIEAYIQNQG